MESPIGMARLVVPFAEFPMLEVLVKILQGQSLRAITSEKLDKPNRFLDLVVFISK
jgi:hypothetical protein